MASMPQTAHEFTSAITPTPGKPTLTIDHTDLQSKYSLISIKILELTKEFSHLLCGLKTAIFTENIKITSKTNEGIWKNITDKPHWHRMLPYPAQGFIRENGPISP
jgi:hypothetical protein